MTNNTKTAGHSNTEDDIRQSGSIRVRFLGILAALLISVGIASRKDPAQHPTFPAHNSQRGSYLILRHPTEAPVPTRAPLLSIPTANSEPPPTPTLRIPAIQAESMQPYVTTSDRPMPPVESTKLATPKTDLPTFRLRLQQ